MLIFSACRVISSTVVFPFSTTKFKCLTIYRRHENIIEIQEGTLADDERSACMRLFMNEKYMTFTTLISKEDERPLLNLLSTLTRRQF